MIPRLERAIVKIEKQISGIPVDERLPENRDYMKYTNLLTSLRTFKTTVEKMEKMLDKLGV